MHFRWPNDIKWGWQAVWADTHNRGQPPQNQNGRCPTNIFAKPLGIKSENFGHGAEFCTLTEIQWLRLIWLNLTDFFSQVFSQPIQIFTMKVILPLCFSSSTKHFSKHVPKFNFCVFFPCKDLFLKYLLKLCSNTYGSQKITLLAWGMRGWDNKLVLLLCDNLYCSLLEIKAGRINMYS